MNLKPVVLLGSESVLKLKREERSVYSIITYMYIYIYIYPRYLRLQWLLSKECHGTN